MQIGVSVAIISQMKSIRFICLMFFLLTSWLAIAQPEPSRRRPASTQPTPPEFIIGIWYPPIASHALWKARGCNTCVGFEHQTNTVTMQQWSESAAGEGLFVIRPPLEKMAEDVTNPYLLAWMHQFDEPDLKGIDPEHLQDVYQQWKKVDPKREIFITISGGSLLFKKTSHNVYKEYFKAADWIGNDFYPITGWNQPTWIARLGLAVEDCRTLSKGKPQFAFIETSSQKLDWLPKNTRGPTAGEVRAEIWEAVIHGVKGIIYFPQQFNPFKYDATPDDVSVELARQNRLLVKLSPIITLPANPKEIEIGTSGMVDVGWRQAADGSVYIIAVNISGDKIKAHNLRVKSDQKFALVDSVLPDKKPLVIENTTLTFDLDPFEVAIWHVKKS